MPHPLTTLLLQNRTAGALIADLQDALVPADREEAYRIQNETVAALGPVGAWKVAPMPETGLPFCSPILKADIVADGAVLERRRLAGLAIEVEIAFVLRHDLPAGATDYAVDEIRPAIGGILPVIEIVASRYADRRAVPQLAAIADLQSSGALVLGKALAVDALPEFGRQAMRLELDGTLAQETGEGATTANALSALAWLAGHAARRGLPLSAGTVVITGARLGPTPFSGERALASADGLGALSVRFI